MSDYMRCQDVCVNLTYDGYGCGFCRPCKRATKAYARAFPIKDRIDAAIRKTKNKRAEASALLPTVFPVDYYPNAMRSPSRGGPPGCAFALGKALRVHKFPFHYTDNYDRAIYTPLPTPATHDAKPDAGGVS